MSWQDRLRKAAYVSPKGTRVEFDYEDVTKLVDKRTAAFNFPDADGTYIQDSGHTGWRYPLRVIFWGEDYDTAAATFEEALSEKGEGVLEHPAYGTINVVPFGEIRRRDKLKTNANQATVEVVFWETTGIIFPTSQTDPKSDILSALEKYNEKAAQELADNTSLTKVTAAAKAKNGYQALLNAAVDGVKTVSGLMAIADTQDDVKRQFTAIVDSINAGIDTLISDPLTLAFQTLLLIQSPARAAAAIEARLSAYGDLATSIFSGEGAVKTPDVTRNPANEYYIEELYAAGYVTGAILSAVTPSAAASATATATQAIETAETVLDLAAAVNDWRDDNLVSLSLIDTGGAYQQLQEAVALTAGFLVQTSFTLKQERRLVLTSPRTVIDVVAEIYGSVDDELDFFINSNALTGSEILELPRGREIVYYI